jgi:hypothetical protein
VFIGKPIGEPIGVGALKLALLCVTGLLTTWVRSSTETIVATKTTAAITSGMIQIGLGIRFLSPNISLGASHLLKRLVRVK